MRQVDPAAGPIGRLWSLLARWFDVPPRLVLLDTGMIAELTPADQQAVVRFFQAITRQDGEVVARTILAMSEERAAGCADPAAFVADMKRLFDSLDSETIRLYTSQVLRDMIETVRQHGVTLKSTVRRRPLGLLTRLRFGAVTGGWGAAPRQPRA